MKDVYAPREFAKMVGCFISRLYGLRKYKKKIKEDVELEKNSSKA